MRLQFLTAAAAALVFGLMTGTGAEAQTVPCEKMLSDVKAALKTAQVSDDDRAKVSDLENKGIERCTADDDTHADAFFTQALAIMHK